MYYVSFKSDGFWQPDILADANISHKSGLKKVYWIIVLRKYLACFNRNKQA
jgi:hypothetical protein